MSTPTVRRTTDADIPALVELRRDWHPDRGDFDESFAEDFAAWYTQQTDRVHWLAELDGAPVGMVNMLVYRRMPSPGHQNRGWGYLGNAYVRPEHRDRGIGTLLLDALLAYAREQNLARVLLSPTERSVPYYERGGFARATTLMINYLDR